MPRWLRLLAPSVPLLLAPPARGDADDALRDLPLVVVPAARVVAPTRTLAILLTGDGGWAALDRAVAATLAARGVGVVGLDTRAYLARPRDPAAAARDVARVARTYATRWSAERVALVGYSRGADMAPFVATRLPADVRARLALVAMLALGSRASFEFHWLDMVRDTPRPTDLAVPPELARLRGTRMLCVYGEAEEDSACRTAPADLVERHARAGAHHFDGDYRALGTLVADALLRR